jgi:hypothetical protein
MAASIRIVNDGSEPFPIAIQFNENPTWWPFGPLWSSSSHYKTLEEAKAVVAKHLQRTTPIVLKEYS